MFRHAVMALVTVVLAASASVPALRAQSAPEPAFEVAFVQANRSGAPYVGALGDRFSEGQFRTTNIPLRLLIRQVFERCQDDDRLLRVVQIVDDDPIAALAGNGAARGGGDHPAALRVFKLALHVLIRGQLHPIPATGGRGATGRARRK